MQIGLFNCTSSQDGDRAVIKMVTEVLTKIISSQSAVHASRKWDDHVALLKVLDVMRNNLDKLPDRNWHAEIELKSAYSGALDVLETSFNTVIAEQRTLR